MRGQQWLNMSAPRSPIAPGFHPSKPITAELNGSARPHRDSATLVLRVLAFGSPATALSNCPGEPYPESPAAW